MPGPGAGVRIEAMTDGHAAAVLPIYQAGIDEGNATFETRAPGPPWPWRDVILIERRSRMVTMPPGREVRSSRPSAARDARPGG